MRVCSEENVGQDVTSIEFGHTFRRIVRIDEHDGTIYLSEKLYMRVDISSLPIHLDGVHAVDVENGQLCTLSKDAQVVEAESRILSDALYRLVSSGGEITYNLLKRHKQLEESEDCAADEADDGEVADQNNSDADKKLEEDLFAKDSYTSDRVETAAQLFITGSYDDQDAGCAYLGRMV